jgi:SAM-dependent methyltransferase
VEGERSLQLADTGSSISLPQIQIEGGKVDPFVRNAIGATNGLFYQHLVGKLADYPIPDLRLPPRKGARFLEIGCSWGRWCIAAARAGYRPVGIDPSLKGIRSARRVAHQLGIDALYLVADGRYLPFRDGFFDQVFSYSVLQHLSKEDVRQVLPEIHRVLRAGGQSRVQMPNVFGLRCLYHQLRRRFRAAQDFEVRYWTPHELLQAFSETIGNATISVDGYFSLNPQVSDVRFLRWRYRPLLYFSELLRRLSEQVSPLSYFADSLFVTAVREH